MPTKRSQKTLNLLLSHKKTVYGVGNEWLMRLDPPIQTVAKLRLKGTVGEAVQGLGMPALMITPHETVAKDAVILHMHGGGYMTGGILQCRALISPICAAAGIPALTFSYRLAPRWKYPAQLEDAYRAYRFLREKGFAPEKIAFVGESAGGNLALELALKLREEGETMPAALALLSPWTDLAQTGESYRTLNGVDATLLTEEVVKSALDFAGSPDLLKDPCISPAYADFHGFPPTLIHCGTREILLSDSEMLEKAMLRDGADALLVRWEGMCHVFQAFGFEESKAANTQLGMFLRKHLTGG